jgi:hypothetical protein
MSFTSGRFGGAPLPRKGAVPARKATWLKPPLSGYCIAWPPGTTTAARAGRCLLARWRSAGHREVNCREFSTGIYIDEASYKSLPDTVTKAPCPHCGQVHNWCPVRRASAIQTNAMCRLFRQDRIGDLRPRTYPPHRSGAVMPRPERCLDGVKCRRVAVALAAGHPIRLFAYDS